MMTPERMADLHARAFEGQGRAWSAKEISDLLSTPHVFVVAKGACFALGRVGADEVELLTIATDPDRQGGGLGRSVLRLYERAARDRGAVSSFLEVADDNHTAIALYRAEGYTQSARREGYYQRAAGANVDALIFSKMLP